MPDEMAADLSSFKSKNNSRGWEQTYAKSMWQGAFACRAIFQGKDIWFSLTAHQTVASLAETAPVPLEPSVQKTTSE
jgi:hypothetical protein